MPPLAAALPAIGGAIGSGLSAVGGGSALAGAVNLAGAGAGILGALKGGGGGGGGGGASIIATNPIIQDLLGTKIVKHKHGSDAGQVSIVRDKKNPGIFGGPEFESSIRNLAFNSPGLFGGENDVIGGLLSSGGTSAALSQALGDLRGLQGQAGAFSAGGIPISVDSALTRTGFPVEVNQALLNSGFGAKLTQDLLQTGFRVDGTPLYALANDNFIRNSLPAIAERVGVTGGGLQSQGFIDTAGREAANLQDAAAAANIALAESAAGRRSQANIAQGGFDDAAGARRAQGFLEQARLQDAAAARRTQGLLLNAQLGDNAQNRALQAIGLQQSLIGAQAALPFAFANDVFSLGNQARSVINQQNAAPLNTFLALNGQSGPLLQQGFNPSGGGTADILGSIGGIANILGPLLGKIGGAATVS